MDELLRIATTTICCETAAIFFLKQGQAEREHLYICGKKDERLPPESYSPGEGLTGRVLEYTDDGRLTGRIVVEKGTALSALVKPEYAASYSQVLPSGQIFSVMAVPIYASTKTVIGILRIMNKLDSAGKVDNVGFTYNDTVTYSIIANLAGSVLQSLNAREQLDELNNINAQFLSITSKNELYSYAQRASIKFFSAEDVSIFEVSEDESGQYLNLVESTTIKRGEPEWLNWQHRSLPKGQDFNKCGLICWVATTKAPFISYGSEYRERDAYRGYDNHYELLPSRDCHTMMIVPLLDHQKHCRGVMRIINTTGSEKIGRFRPEDFYMAQILASQLAIAVWRERQHARKIEERTKRIFIQDKLLELHQNIQSILSSRNQPEMALQAIAETGVEILGVDLACIYPNNITYVDVEPYNNRWIRIGGNRLSNNQFSKPRPNGAFSRTLKSENGYLQGFPDEEELSAPFMQAEKIKTWLGIRLEDQELNSGVIFFASRTKRVFSNDDVQTGKILARIAALTLQAVQVVIQEDSIRAELQQQRQDMLRDQELLLELMPHELETPAIVARNHLYMYFSGLLSPEKQQDRLKTAHEELVHICELLKRIKALVEYSTQPLKLEPANLVTIVDRVTENFYSAAKEKNIDLIHTYPVDLPHVNAQENAIMTVFELLVQNALKYTPSQGSIAISYTVESGLVKIHCKDTGQGIHPDELYYIFEKGFKGSNAGSSGSGFGLYFARTIAERHNGQLTAQSELGKGTCFTLTLPLLALGECGPLELERAQLSNN
ncbi:MAG TPA: ATP-binding protein [Chloroflexia bacterium]|nr:ATP-binding protein [Chloroflexia bacterium]